MVSAQRRCCSSAYNRPLPAAVKLVLIFAAIVGTYGLGIYLRYWREARLASDVVLLLGCLFYGLCIWLTQIFHMLPTIRTASFGGPQGKAGAAGGPGR